MNPFSHVTGDIGDILNMCVHKFYDMVQYWEQTVGFPLPQSKLGRYIGPCKKNGNKMAMNILIANRLIVQRNTVIPPTIADLNRPDKKQQRAIFDNLIRKKHGDSMNLLPQQKKLP